MISGVESVASDPSNGNVFSKQYEITSYSFYRYCLLGLQAVISTSMNLVYLPFSLFASVCLLPDDVNRGQIIASILFYSGIATMVQAVAGIKFPVMMSPSIVFISGAVKFLNSPDWEIYSAGDLYAMGPSLRHEEFSLRTRELRGVLIIGGFISLFICGILCRFCSKLPSTTVSATLISFSLSNVTLFLTEKSNSIFILWSFLLSLMFYTIGNYQITNFRKSYIEKFFLNLINIHHFPVLLTFIILTAVGIKSGEENHSLLERAIGPHHWFSFNTFKFTDIAIPQFTTNSLVMLPVLCNQFIISYCCYQAVEKGNGEYLKAMTCESLMIVISSGLGSMIPLTIDPASIGLIQMTKVKNTEPSIIAGSSLILASILVKVIAMFSYTSYPVICGLNAFLWGHLFVKGLKDIEMDTESSNIVAMSVLCGMVSCSTISVEIGRSTFFSIVRLVTDSPVVVTFLTSIMLSLAFRSTK